MDSRLEFLFWTPEQVWDRLDRSLVDAKIMEVCEEMQRGAAQDARDAQAEAIKTGNSATYLPARSSRELERCDDWIERELEACVDTWRSQGYVPCPGLYKVFESHWLDCLLAAREGTLKGELNLQDTRIGRPGRSASVLSDFARQMHVKRKTWSRKLRILAKESEYQIRQLSKSSTRNSGSASEDQGVAAPGVAHTASVFSWKELESRFRALVSDTNNVTASFTRTTWQSGFVSNEWNLGGDPVLKQQFGHLASIASRKLGYSSSTRAEEQWLGRVRQWIEESRLDRNVAWLPTGSVNACGPQGETRVFYTERIAEISAMFCIYLLAEGVPESPATTSGSKDVEGARIGRPRSVPPAFVEIAGTRWREAQERAKNRRVSDEVLLEIAESLDQDNFIPPSDFLEKPLAAQIKQYNSKHANSKEKPPIQTWERLIRSADKDFIRGMRRKLSRCANALSENVSGQKR